MVPRSIRYTSGCGKSSWPCTVEIAHRESKRSVYQIEVVTFETGACPAFIDQRRLGVDVGGLNPQFHREIAATTKVQHGRGIIPVVRNADVSGAVETPAL